MSWKLFDNLKDGKLGEVDTNVTFDRAGATNLAASLFIAGVLIILAWWAITKKM